MDAHDSDHALMNERDTTIRALIEHFDSKSVRKRHTSVISDVVVTSTAVAKIYMVVFMIALSVWYLLFLFPVT